MQTPTKQNYKNGDKASERTNKNKRDKNNKNQEKKNKNPISLQTRFI